MNSANRNDTANRSSIRVDEARVAEALEEYQSLARAGRRPSREAFLARYPELAPNLAECLDGLAFVRSAADDLGRLSDDPGADLSAAIPEALGDFRIVREVGRGGMAVVYEAEQISLRRRVALKVLPFAAVMDSRHLQRFKNEALAAAGLDHPHVVKVHAVGQDRGVHYIAMQFIEGRTLADLICERRDGPTAAPIPSVGDQDVTRTLAPDATDDTPAASERKATPSARPTSRTRADEAYTRQVAEWGIQAAEALEHAHAVGVVHRDVKPSNLLVDGKGNLYVADFGLAKLSVDPGVTGTGDLLGTIRYMSPEQASAKHDLVDHRSDVYSLGVTLYELLTLTPAFEGPSRQQILSQVVSDDPVRPRKLDARIPRDLETVILKAIAKEPEKRYLSAKELAEDLRRFLADEPIRAKRPGPLDQVRKFARRNRGVVWAGAVGGVLTVVGLTIGLVEARRQKDAARAEAVAKEDARQAEADQRQKAEDQTRHAEEQTKRADNNYRQARAAVKQMLTRVATEEIDRLPEMREVRRQLLEDAVRFYTELLQTAPRDAVAFFERAEVYRLLSRLDEAVRDYESSLEIDSSNADRHISLGDVLDTKGEERLAITHYLRAVEIDPKNANAHSSLMYIYSKVGNLEGTRKALKSFAELAPPSANTSYRIALGHLLLKEPREALRHARRAVEQDPQSPSSHLLLAQSLRAIGDREGCLAALDAGIRAITRQNEFKNGDLYKTRGELYLEARQYEPAATDFTRAIEIVPLGWYNYKRRAVAYFHLGNYAGALADIAKAVELRPDDASNLTWIHPRLVAACPDAVFRQGMLDQATRAIELNKRSATVVAYRGRMYQAMKEYAKAEGDFRKAVELNPKSGTALESLAWFLANCPDLKLRDPKQAVTFAAQAVELEPKQSEYWNTLGAARYRNGDWNGAVEALTMSRELRRGGDADDFFFLAMSRWQLGHKDDARRWFDRGVIWMDGRKSQDERLHRIRAEAAELLGILAPPPRPKTP